MPLEIRLPIKELSHYLCLTWPMTKNRIIQLYHLLYVPNMAPNTNLLTKTKLTLKGKDVL